MTNQGAKSTSVEAMIKEMAKGVAEQLAEADQGDMRLDIEISGRTLGPELKIEFVLGEDYSISGSVRGGSLNEVVKEFLRRKGWSSRNAPLMLTSGLRDELNDDIPF